MICKVVTLFDEVFWLNAGLSLISAFMAVLFLQSGIDKVKDYQGNLGWLIGHFKDSVFNGMVPFLLKTLTVLELTAGAFSLLASVGIWITHDPTIAGTGLLLSGISLLALFLGQRIAKDYPGAASLAPYFAVVLIGFLLLAYADRDRPSSIHPDLLEHGEKVYWPQHHGPHSEVKGIE